MVFVRRILTVSFWPLIDLVITFFGNFMLVKFSVLTAVVATVVLATLFNFLFLYLLYFEEGIPHWVAGQVRRLGLIHAKISQLERGKTFAVLAVYIISGPAMAGAPLIWLLGMRRSRAYTLAALGVAMNSVVWVGGVYNLFWSLVRGLL